MTAPLLSQHDSSFSKQKPQPNLLSLGADIHHRILDYLLYPPHIDKENYPRMPCTSALSLAMSCRTMQALVTSRNKSDIRWWDDPHDFRFHIWTGRFHTMALLFIGTVFAGLFLLNSALEHWKYDFFCLAEGSLDRVLRILTKHPPPVRSIDFLEFESGVPALYDSLSLFLRCVENNLE